MAFISSDRDENDIVPSRRKDLQDLLDLSRTASGSYLRKQSRPRAPRATIAATATTPAPPTTVAAQVFRTLAEFLPTRLVKWVCEYLRYRFGPRHAFQVYAQSAHDQGIYKFDDDGDTRIALAGDWGTGTDEANCVAQSIESFQPHYSIHLGDVYFVGDPTEVDENFLGINSPNNDFAPCKWPAGSRGSFALNGNHEMYARGNAYFDRMLPRLGLMSNGQPLGQKTSYFCLENKYWRIIALDTGYNSISWPILEDIVEPSCALTPEQVAWLQRVVQPGDDRSIIVLTHHQYYSRYDDCYPTPARQLAKFLKGRTVLWFWGHEHLLAIYQKPAASDGIEVFGRCIGHGGMPIELPSNEPKHSEYIVEFMDNRHYRNDEHLVLGYNGYAQLSLQGDRASVRYVDLKGKEVFFEEWAATGGGLERLQHRHG